jgi:hypothetical protein
MAKNRKTSGSAVPSSKRVRLLHVVPVEGGWAVRSPRKLVSTHDTEEQARSAAISLAAGRNTDVIIHDADGGVKEHVSVPDEILMQIWKDIYYHPERWNF